MWTIGERTGPVISKSCCFQVGFFQTRSGFSISVPFIPSKLAEKGVRGG